jgi:hypothetical protein
LPVIVFPPLAAFLPRSGIRPVSGLAGAMEAALAFRLVIRIVLETATACAKSERMTRYFFDLRDGSDRIRDAEGVDLEDEVAAIAHARSLAGELMKNRELQTRHWLVHVTGENGERVCEVGFATVDKTLDHLRADTRKLIEQRCEKHLALAEAIACARAIVCQSRALVNRSRGKPYLRTDHWGALVA